MIELPTSEDHMHVHSTQVNPYAALDALRSAQRANAKREAEMVRKELMESASELAGESDISDACIVKLEKRGESEKRPKRRNQKEQNRAEQQEPNDSEEVDHHVSDWA